MSSYVFLTKLQYTEMLKSVLSTHWCCEMHCASVITAIIGSDNGLSPVQHQAIICTNAGLLSIGPLGRNFTEICIEIQTFSFKKMHLKMSSISSRPQCVKQCINVGLPVEDS